MFKVTVWTRPTLSDNKTKCIFQGQIPFIPRIGESIMAREGFCTEVVEGVTYNLIDGSVEITINWDDRRNEYGPCVFKM